MTNLKLVCGQKLHRKRAVDNLTCKQDDLLRTVQFSFREKVENAYGY